MSPGEPDVCYGMPGTLANRVCTLSARSQNSDLGEDAYYSPGDCGYSCGKIHNIERYYSQSVSYSRFSGYFQSELVGSLTFRLYPHGSEVLLLPVWWGLVEVVRGDLGVCLSLPPTQVNHPHRLASSHKLVSP